MTYRDWYSAMERVLTDDERVSYGELIKPISNYWDIGGNATVARDLGQWVKYNTDGSLTVSWPPPKEQVKAPEQELKLGDTKPLDDFLETFATKE